jgi:hypothetical protein
VRVLFINDTARNGGPGRSLHSILRFLDPAVVHRAVVLPRDGAIAELLARDGVADELIFEPDLVENPIEPWDRAMERRDFDAPGVLKAARFAGNVVKSTRGMAPDGEPGAARRLPARLLQRDQRGLRRGRAGAAHRGARPLARAVHVAARARSRACTAA